MNYRKIYIKIISNALQEQENGKRIRLKDKHITIWSKKISSSNFNKDSIKNSNYRYVERKMKGTLYKILEKRTINPKWIYYERHHILPKALFPLWIKRKSNVVLLTAREHFFCHQLLREIYPGSKMSYALWQMMNGCRKEKVFKFTSKYYEKIKLEFSLLSKSAGHKNKGKVRTEEMRKRVSEGTKKAMNRPEVKAYMSKATIEYAKTHPEEMKERAKTRLKNNPNIQKELADKLRGRHIYTNGIIIKHLDVCPEGWTLYKRPGTTWSTRKWYNNGIHNIRVPIGQLPPEGFKEGRTHYKFKRNR